MEKIGPIARMLKNIKNINLKDVKILLFLIKYSNL